MTPSITCPSQGIVNGISLPEISAPFNSCQADDPENVSNIISSSDIISEEGGNGINLLQASSTAALNSDVITDDDEMPETQPCQIQEHSPQMLQIDSETSDFP